MLRVKVHQEMLATPEPPAREVLEELQMMANLAAVAAGAAVVDHLAEQESAEQTHSYLTQTLVMVAMVERLQEQMVMREVLARLDHLEQQIMVPQEIQEIPEQQEILEHLLHLLV
jgi:glutamate-1-semialdehyde aminotransferase